MKNKVFLLSILFGILIVQCGGKEKEETFGIKLEPDVPIEYSYRFPEDFDSNEPPPLVIVLHGYDRDENEATWLWDEGFFYEPDFILLSVRAPFKGKDGFKWLIKSGNNEVEQLQFRRASARICEKRVLDALDEFIENKNFEPDLVYLLGLSQGSIISFYIGLMNADIFDGIATIAGYMDTTLFSEPKIDECEDMEIFLAFGRKEETQKVDAAKKTVNLLSKAGAKVRFYLHDEGHTINAQSCRAMQNFFELSLEEAPEDDIVYKSNENYDTDDEDFPEDEYEEEDESDYQEE